MSTPKDACVELNAEIKALDTSGQLLSAFDERRVNDIVRHCGELEQELNLFASNRHIDPTDPYYAQLPAFVKAAQLRDKRALTSYLTWRLGRIELAWWRSLEHATASKCSAAETEYLKALNKTMIDYMQSFEVNLDLRAFVARPPDAIPTNIVEVRGKRNVTYTSPLSNRVVDIYVGKTVTLAYEEAEGLLQRGDVEWA